MSTNPSTSQLIYFGVTEFLTKKMEAHNVRVANVCNPKTAFSGSLAVAVTPTEYIKSLVKNFEVSPGVIVVMLIYIERLLSKMESEYKAVGGHDPILFTSFNAHRIILATFLVAQKYCEDRNYRLASIARAGGIERDELIFLENELLDFMQFNLFVDKETFDNYVNSALVYSKHLCSRTQT
jgi:hypothetical protein